MKKALLIHIAVILTFTAFSQTWIRVEEATKYKGETINLVGLVTTIKNVSAKKIHIMLNGFNVKDSDQSLILVVRKRNRSKVKETSEASYLGQYVQVNGRVAIHKGQPQIVVSDMSQLSIVREPRREDLSEPM